MTTVTHPAAPAPGAPATPPPDPPVKTIADEQRERSAEIEKEGIEAFKARLDQRTEEEKAGRVVTGVAHRPVEAHEASRR
jgi:hypothetical protein